MTTAIDTAALRRIIEVEQTAYLWGKPHQITPRLVDESFGDGGKLLGLSATNLRPDYWVVRIGTDWSLDFSKERLGPILNAIELEFGECGYDEDGEYSDDLDEADSFPKADFSAGCEWFEIDWPIGD